MKLIIAVIPYQGNNLNFIYVEINLHITNVCLNHTVIMFWNHADGEILMQIKLVPAPSKIMRLRLLKILIFHILFFRFTSSYAKLNIKADSLLLLNVTVQIYLEK